MTAKKSPRDIYLRKRFARVGAGGFMPRDALELLLGYCLSGQKLYSAIDGAFDRYRSLGEMLNADKEELYSIPGMTESAAFLLTAVLPAYKAACDEMRVAKLESPEDACRYFEDLYRGMRAETFLVACVDARGNIYRIFRAAEGSTFGVGVNPHELADKIRQLKCRRCIFSHNHPGGTCEPSEADRESTAYMAAELRKVGCSVIDHIVVGRNGARSMFFGAQTAPNGEPGRF